MSKKKLSQRQVDLIQMFLFILILLVFANYEAARKIKPESPETNFTVTESPWDKLSSVAENS